MSQRTDGQAAALADDLRAALAALDRARRALAANELNRLDEVWPVLERSASRIAELDPARRAELEPFLLALLDDVERTIEAFGAELRAVRDRIELAGRNRAAGEAYRRARPG
jgi:hypothetical protein